jgi:predicted dehydrogenase
MKNVGIIGCGRISKNHIIALSNNTDISNLIAVCDIIREKAELRSKEYFELTGTKPKVYTDYKEMIINENLDIIGIATESGYHYEQAKYCLENDVNVLVEKPMALKTEHAEEMIKLANDKNLNLGVCFQNRFNPPIQELRKIIDNGGLGKIYAVSANIYWNRGKQYYEQAPWRGTYALDGGALMNQCIHNIDLLQWTAGGEVQRINALLSNFNHDYLEVEDYGSIQLQFDNGVIGNIQGTVAVYPKNYKENLIVLGEKGTIEISGLAVNEIVKWDVKDSEETLDSIIEKTTSKIKNVYGNGHTPLYKDFIDSVVEQRKSYIPGEEGIKALNIILDSYHKEGVKL